MILTTLVTYEYLLYRVISPLASQIGLSPYFWDFCFFRLLKPQTEIFHLHCRWCIAVAGAKKYYFFFMLLEISRMVNRSAKYTIYNNPLHSELFAHIRLNYIINMFRRPHTIQNWYIFRSQHQSFFPGLRPWALK